MKHQTGSIILYSILALLVVSIGGGVVFTYQHAIKKAERMENQFKEEQALRIRAEGDLQLTNALNEHKIIQLNLEFDARLQQDEQTRDRVAKANAGTIAKTMERDADKYTEFTERVMGKNFELLTCESDYRRLRDETACIGHVR